MKNTKAFAAVVLMLVFGLGSAFAEHKVNKKKKIVVAVQEDGNCSQGISLTGEALGGAALCADNPQGVGSHFQKYVGSEIEVEARWAFDGNPKSGAPIAVGRVFKIGREKVNDPCALGKVGFLAGVMMVANGADANDTVNALTPGCDRGTSDDGGDQE